MSSDFSARARDARGMIPVPQAPLDAIRRRSRAARSRGRIRTLAACAVLSVGAIGAAGFGERIYTGARVWLRGGDVAVQMPSFDMVREPMARDLRDVIAHATFPVVLPAGLPAGSHLSLVGGSPAGHASTIFLTYHTHAGADGPTFMLLDPAVVDRADVTKTAPEHARAVMSAVYEWRIGNEVVLAARRHVTPGDVDRMKTAMAASSPSETLAATQPALARIIVLGGPNRLELAQRYSPANGTAVLLDRAMVRSLPSRIARREPMLDTRIIHVTKIAYKNGLPGYRHASVVQNTAVAVPLDGMRAIAAVLHRAGVRDGTNCDCEVLYSRSGASAYRVAIIPLTPGSAAETYAVDARTFAVSPGD